MKSIRLIVGVTVVGFGLAVGCGDDTKTNTPAEGGDGNSTSGTGGTKGGSNNVAGTKNNGDGGMSTGDGGTSPGTDGGTATSGGGPDGPGCGNGPACDAGAEECIGGKCLSNDGEACSLNSQCIHTCINELCAPRADVLEDCDFAGGGAGGGGSGGAGAGQAGQAGEGGEGIYVPPEENGNGDDLDCLDGLACDSGSCKRKQQTDCTGPEQCLSGLCHKSKCTLAEAGKCSAVLCGAPTNAVCAPTTTATDQCNFNYIPNSSCTVDFKGIYCYESCACQLKP